MDSDVESVEITNGIDDLRKRLEKILAPSLAAPVDESQLNIIEAESMEIASQREAVSLARLLGM